MIARDCENVSPRSARGGAHKLTATLLAPRTALFTCVGGGLHLAMASAIYACAADPLSAAALIIGSSTYEADVKLVREPDTVTE